MTDNRFKEVISTIMAVTIAFTGLTLGAPSYAANRKPSSTSVTSVKAINKKRSLAQAIKSSIRQTKSLLKKVLRF